MAGLFDFLGFSTPQAGGGLLGTAGASPDPMQIQGSSHDRLGSGLSRPTQPGDPWWRSIWPSANVDDRREEDIQKDLTSWAERRYQDALNPPQPLPDLSSTPLAAQAGHEDAVNLMRRLVLERMGVRPVTAAPPLPARSQGRR